MWQGDKSRACKPMPDFYAIAWMAVSTVAMIFLGTYFVALFYLLWLPRAYAKGHWIVGLSKDLIFPAFILADALASTLWSDHRGLTLRTSLEFASLIYCTAIMTRLVTTPAFIKGIILGVFLSLMAMAISSNGLPTDTPLIGSLGSKNQVGAAAEIGFYCALLCWFFDQKKWQKLVFSFLPLVLFTLFLWGSQSATSNVSLIAMLGVSGAAYFLTKLPLKFRVPVFVLFLCFAGLLLLLGMWGGLEDVGLKTVGKDVTLTGRTQLWHEGMRIGMQNPFGGVGFGAFWVPGTPEAEKIWYEFDIGSRFGFHFHNLFVNLFVEIGAIGCLLWVLMYLSTCAKSALYVLRQGASVESIFYMGVAFMYLVRAMTEVDTSGPYGMASLLFFFVVIRVTALRAPSSAKRMIKSEDITADKPQSN